MNKKVAQFLSVALHPVLMPIYALLFIFQNKTFFSYSIPYHAKLALFLIIILNTLIFPVLVSFILVKKGVIRSFEMEKREERLIPFASNLLLMMVAAYLINELRLPQVFFVAGLLGSVRMTLGANSAVQIYLGFLIGFFCEFLFLSL